VAGYYAHITALDECFGRILRELGARGLDRNTIVVFSSDHGDMLYSQDRGWKCKPWLESTNIPFLIRWPGRVSAGAVRDTPFGLVDVMPTLLDLAGVRIPAAVEGVSAAAALRGESAGAESVFLDMPVVPQVYSFREWRGVATRTHTYATFRDRPWILHDDIGDPYQMRNLAGEPGHERLRRHMDSLLRGWMARTGDAFETSEAVADRLYPGHVNCVIPFYENEPVRQARERRFGTGR
jgi:arylsulfatase A-like enzyme